MIKLYRANTLGFKCLGIFVMLLFGSSVVKAQTPNTTVVPATTTQTLNPLPAAYAEGSENFVRVWQATKPITVESDISSSSRTLQEVKQTTQYYDALGRLLQTVAEKASPQGKDMVSPILYDVYGREVYKYLPYVDTGSNGNFKLNPFNLQNTFLKTVYNPTNNAAGEKFFYSQMDFETSPLNRPKAVYAAGNSWVGRAKGVSSQYNVNTAQDSVRIWKISFMAGATPTSTAYYAAGQLFKTVTTDENGSDVVEYKDKENHVVLKKTEVISASSTGPYGWLNTYYIYDELNNLRFVLQPKATDWLKANNWTFDATTCSSSTIAKELCFSYEYDGKQRMIIKRVPGAGEEWMVYDARDRLVMVQDSIQRAASKWLYTSYDNLNRQVLTGAWTTSGDRNYHQNLAKTSITYPSPTSGNEVYTETYYDNYSWVNSSGSGLSSTLITANGITGTAYFYAANNNSFPYPQALTGSSATKGMVTGTRIKVLRTNTYLYTVNFYDDRGRVIQTQSTNYTGGKDTLTNQYSFSGQLLRTLVCHQKGGANAQSLRMLTKMEYDAGGRLLNVYKKTGNSPEVTLTENQYDELGQLVQKSIGRKRNTTNQNTYTSAPLDTLDYEYNIRGWLRGINKDYARNVSGTNGWFGFELCYDFGFTAGQLNGNIAGVRWRSSGDGEQRAYGFTYDMVNRLTKANFTQYTSGTWNTDAGVDFSVPEISYDQNGNILKMRQKGLKISGSSLIDSLNYGYVANSNRLNYVQDLQNDPTSLLGDFKEASSNISQDYWYNGNGSLIKDNNKGINSIDYNYMNQPMVVTVAGKGTVTYNIDALGNKLRKVTVDNTVSPSVTTTTDYVGLFTYQNDSLQFIATEEGRVRPRTNGKTDTMYYDYMEKDHLGNVRVVLTDELKTDVYPVLDWEGTAGTAAVANQDSVWNNSSGQAVGVVANRTTKAGFGTSGNFVRQLTKSTGAMGANMLLKVMSGDQLNVSLDYYYTATSADNSTANGLTTLTNSLLAAITGSTNVSASVKAGAGPTVSNMNNVGSPVATYLNSKGETSSTTTGQPPKAYLHIMLFNEQFVFDNVNSVVQPVSTANAASTITKLVTAKKNGYAYIYFSNESESFVWFDNFKVIDTRGPLMEENHYYPFGLTMAGISSQAANVLESNKKYQSQEFAHKEFSDGSGLELYEFKYRMDDPQIGRFWQIDPLADKYVYNSTYAFSENKVTVHVELEGKESDYIFKYVKQDLANTFNAFGNWIDNTLNYFNKTSTSTVVSTAANVQTTSGTTVTNTVSTNLGGKMSYLTYHNTLDGNSEPMIKTTTTVSADSKTEIKTPGGSITNKTSVTNDGVVTNEVGFKKDVVVYDVPASVSGSTAINSKGQTTLTAQGTVKTPGAQPIGQMQYSTDGKKQSVSVGVGGQTTAGKTTTTTIFGIKLNW